ncbi:hypothetical protein AB6E16_21210 [Vibrio atlanticus]|uniref:hypothetical protein n=2 Tax=Vibrionaceae TaxID=641 RepID=UPI00354D248F
MHVKLFNRLLKELDENIKFPDKSMKRTVFIQEKTSSARIEVAVLQINRGLIDKMICCIKDIERITEKKGLSPTSYNIVELKQRKADLETELKIKSALLTNVFKEAQLEWELSTTRHSS